MQHLARYVDDTDTRLENGKVTDRHLLNVARSEMLNATLAGVLSKPGPRNSNPSLARHRFVHGRHRGTRIYDQSRGVAIEHGRDFEVIASVQPHRNSSESSAGKKTGQLLTDWAVRTVWIDVKHLASAIDKHPKFTHLPGTDQTIEVRQS